MWMSNDNQLTGHSRLSSTMLLGFVCSYIIAVGSVDAALQLAPDT